jgi:ADP-ribose pyrophosphatase
VVPSNPIFAAPVAKITTDGGVAKWQGTGLQNPDHRFESGRRLQRSSTGKERDMTDADASSPDVTLRSETVHRGKLLTVRVDTVRLPSGRETGREVVVHPGAIALVPMLPDGRVIFVRQWRHAVGQALLELPAGTREEGEEPATTAARELTEETGYTAERLVPLGRFFTAPGFCTEEIHCYLALGLAPGSAKPEEDEGITLEPLPLAETAAVIARGDIHDAKTIAALAMARQYLDTHPEDAP